MAGMLDQTLGAIEALKRSNTPDAVCTCLTTFTGCFGLTSMLSGTMPSTRDHGNEQDKHLLASSYPHDWMTRYLEREYVHIDPVIRRIQSDLSPFQWTEAASYVADDNRKVVSQLNSEAADHSLKVGVAIPMLTLDGSVAAVSLGGEKMELPPRALGMISLISSFAIGRAIELRTTDDRRRNANLTHREVECLKWVADGKSEWEISVILSISEHTADKHISNARRKLSAATRTQAVAHAMRLGLIS